MLSVITILEKISHEQQNCQVLDLGFLCPLPCLVSVRCDVCTAQPVIPKPVLYLLRASPSCFLFSLSSDRMLKLCLDLRGFYLKSGQFLGTRHDFMPKIFLKKLG